MNKKKIEIIESISLFAILFSFAGIEILSILPATLITIYPALMPISTSILWIFFISLILYVICLIVLW